MGDAFADGVVEFIELDQVGVRRGDRLEIIELGGQVPAPAVAPRASGDPTALQITGQELAALQADPTPLLTGARFVPSLRDGRADGLRVFSVVPGSFFARAGLQNGDLIRSIGGWPAANPMGLAAHLPELVGARRVEVTVERNGASRTLAVERAD